jgi:hypothetical protein
MMKRIRWTKVALALWLSLALPAASLAHADTAPTRTSYREAVEPICQANAKANERILAGVRPEVRAGKLAPAAAQFAKAARALKATLRQLSAVPQPSADAARLGEWLADIKAEAALFERIAVQLRAGKKSLAEHTVVELTTNADKANNLVPPFEFHYCRFEPSRFT